MRKRLLLVLGSILVGMIGAAGIAHWLAPDDWQPVEATITATRIRSSRPGTPQWSVMADVRYIVDGRTFDSQDIEIYRDEVREASAARQRNLPPGSVVTLYYREADPGEVSVSPDGGRQATIVLSALMVPVVSAMLFFVLALMRASRRSQSN